ncbi:zinc ribbon domain-containing protein [uncultured Friedmanniella sp.]|uniref:double zinc ribbon domain-containing protein n=1 Tax=uncultured Friedmanniella sp. TaxID=335381 RepID=UPI0035CC3DE2
MDVICDACGGTNRAGAEFCVHCNAFLAWDGSGGAAPPTTVRQVPPATSPTAATDAPTVLNPTVVNSTVATGTAWTPVTPSSVTATMPQTEVGPVGETCPSCGLVNAPGLRFCAHCGYGFASSVPEQPGAPDPYADQSAAAADRAARRAYRRSLPPLYRWRRVLVSVVVAVLVLGGLLWVRHPVRAARDTWYRVSKQYTLVSPVVAFVVPPTSTVPGSDPAALVDRTVREWTETWQPTSATACGAAPGTGEIVLTFAPTRIRRLQIVPGLDKSNPRRSQQLLPQEIGITYPGGRCQRVLLDRGDRQQPIRLDSGVRVTSVRIGIGSVYPGAPDTAQLVSLTEVVLLSYPR